MVNRMMNAFENIDEEEALKIVNKANSVISDNRNIYLVLIEGEYPQNDVEIYKTYVLIIGRQKTYDWIKKILTDDEDGGPIINTTASKVLVEPEFVTPKTPRISLRNMFSVHRFMTEMLEAGKVVDEHPLDMDEYYDEYADDIKFVEDNPDYE